MMKNLANKIVALFLILLIVFSFSCENNDEKDGGISIEIVPESPYNSPIWHPDGQFIGFNHTPLKQIIYPDGNESLDYQQVFDYDSTGFGSLIRMNQYAEDFSIYPAHTVLVAGWGMDYIRFRWTNL